MAAGTLNQQSHRHNWFRCTSVIIPVRSVIVLITLALALLAAGCGSSDGEPTETGPISYQVTFVASSDGGVGPTRAVIRLDEEFAVLDGNTGCHRVLGSFTLDDTSGNASFTVPGLSTNTCDPSELQVEELLLDAFDGVTSFLRSDQQLQFFGADQNRLLVLEPIS